MLKEEKVQRGSVWARDKVQRFENKTVSVSVGPGNYSAEPVNGKPRPKSLSAGFKSKTVRSFFDTIVYDTTSRPILERRLELGYKNEDPGPGSYNVQSTQHDESDKYKNHTFGSTIRRFEASSK